MTRWRSLTTASLLVAVGIVLSLFVHAFGIGGQVLLPLHLPAFLAGFLLPGSWALIVGFSLPMISALIIGMPPIIPYALLMAPELMTYAIICRFLRKPLQLLPSLIIAMIAGRIVWGLGAWLMVQAFGFHISILAGISSGIFTGLPGIISQIIVIPILIKRVEAMRSVQS
jgi:hypothetical protein